MYVCVCVCVCVCARVNEWGCVTCITWHLAPLLSCSKDGKSNAMWQVNPLISVILHPDPAAATHRYIQIIHTKNDHNSNTIQENPAGLKQELVYSKKNKEAWHTISICNWLVLNWRIKESGNITWLVLMKKKPLWKSFIFKWLLKNALCSLPQLNLRCMSVLHILRFTMSITHPVKTVNVFCCCKGVK